MKNSILLLVVLLGMNACETPDSNHQNTVDMEAIEKEAIKKVLFTYRDALNNSSVSEVLPLYTENGVFMPSGAPSAIGQAQLKAAYEFVFSNIQLSIEFYLDEIEVVGDYAFARSTSRGTTIIHATGDKVPEENREIFVLKKEHGAWKIDRYMFNKMQ